MSIRLRHAAPAFLHLATLMLAATPALAGSWQNTAPFGAALKGDLYTPTTPGTSPAILVVIHMCSGHSSTVHGWFDSAADSHGFYLIAPDAGKNCFDASISRSATSDPGAIVTMVNYVLAHTTADKNRVFAAGMSSGGCMTNTLLAVFPDVFAGGSAMPGFPAGLWPAGDTSCTKCSSTPSASDTGQKYASMATSAFTWSGTRPCSEQWVGGGDQYNFNGWLPVVASQFQILGNLGSGTSATAGISGWTRTVYKDTSGNVRLETNLGPSSQKHDLETVGSSLYAAVVTFLGLDKPTGACGSTSTGTGGGSSTGGASSAGGTSSTGGTKATTGGTSAISTGGTKATGGMASTSTGGTKANTGGAPTNGGTSSGGGTKATGGSANSTGGGVNPTGGVNGTTGGSSTAGGNGPTGGTTGVAAAGNGNPTGGAGAVATSSAANAGGGNAATGGEAAVGGNTAVANTGAPPAQEAGSCGCRVAGKPDSSRTLMGLGLLGLVLTRARRRKTASK